METFERILCPIDFSDGSRGALVMAGALAHWYEAGLTVLHVHANWPVADMLPSLRPVEARPLPLARPARQNCSPPKPPAASSIRQCKFTAAPDWCAALSSSASIATCAHCVFTKALRRFRN